MTTTAAPRNANHLFALGMAVYFQPEDEGPVTSGTIIELRLDGEASENTYTIEPANGGESVIISESQIQNRRSSPAEVEAAASAPQELPPLPVTVHWHENNSYRLNMELDVADFLEYIRGQSSDPLSRSVDDAMFDDLILAADSGTLTEGALLLGFRERITEALSDERRRSLACILQAYFVEQAWPDSSWVKNVTGDNDIDEVDLPEGPVVVLDRTTSPGNVHMRGAAFGGFRGSATDLIEQTIPEDPAFATAFIDGRYSATTVHLLPDYLRPSVEDLLGRVVAEMKSQSHRFRV